MRKPFAPTADLSRDGRLALVEYNYEFSLVVTATGSMIPLDFSHEITAVAIAPTGSLFVVAGSDNLSLYEVHKAPRLVKSVKIPAQLLRVAVGEQGLVAGITRLDETRSSLCSWQGPSLQPDFKGSGEELGPVAPLGIEMDEAHRQIMVWGLEGLNAFSGSGNPYARLISLANGQVEVLWAAEDSPVDAPEGFLLPLAGGKLGIYDRDQLAIVDPNEPEIALKTYRFGGLETVAVSPGGQYLVWLTSGQSQAHRLRVAALEIGRVVTDLSLPGIGAHPALAVNDGGQVTVINGRKPANLIIITVDDRQKIAQTQLNLADKVISELRP